MCTTGPESPSKENSDPASNPTPEGIRYMTIEALEEPEKPSDHRIWLIRRVIEALLGLGALYIASRFGVG